MSLQRNIGNVLPGTQTDADKILNAISEPQLMPGIQVATVVPVSYGPSDVAPTSNATPVAAITPAVVPADNTLLYLGVGAGLLLLLAKKKKRVGSSEGGSKKSMMPLLLVGGGVLAWYLYTQSQAAAATTATTITTTDPATGAVVTTPVAQTGITVAPSVTLPDMTTMHNQLYAYSIPWRYAVDRLSLSDMQALYTYVYAYLQKGLRLYGYPGIYQDGWYDINLYNTLKALNSKWSLGLLN